MKKRIYLKKQIIGLAMLGLFATLNLKSYSGTIKGIQGIEVTGTLSLNAQQQLNQAFKNYQVFKLDAKALYNSVQVQSGTRAESNVSNLNLQLGAQSFNLTLKQRDFTSKDVKIFVSSEHGIGPVLDLPSETYQGYVDNDPSQIAAFSIRSDYFEGVIQNKDGKKFYIEPLQNIAPEEARTDSYVFYDVDDAKTEIMTCAYTNAVSRQTDIINQSARQVSAANVGFRIGLFCDKTYASKRGGAINAISSMLNTLNMTEAFFYAPAPPKGFNFHFKVTVIYVSAADEITPESQLNIVTILANFRDWANAKTTPFKPVDYDNASFWTPRSMTGTVANPAGQAYGPNPGGACSTQKYNVLRSNFQWACPLAYAVDQAHETGHNLNCSHTPVTSPLPTDIMQPSIYQSANQWASSSASLINGFISGNSGCIKAATAFIPEPNFISDKSYGCGGTVTVAFTNTTDFSDAPTTYAWDFGDGQTSTQTSPSHTFNTVGKFTVKLTATNSNGSATETKTNYIWVGSNAANVSQFIPVNKTTAGGAYDVPSNTAWRAMEFKALDNIELVSFKMDANIAGPRLLYLTADSSFSLIDTKEVVLPANVLTKVDLNWRLQKGRRYSIYIHEDGLINGKQYYNQCYRLNAGTNNYYNGSVDITGLISMLGNQLTMETYYGRPNGTGAENLWYIGFDWEIKRLCDISVGMNEEKKNNMFDVFPNPGNGLYTVRFLNVMDNDALIDVFNILGEKVFSEKIKTTNAITEESIDLTSLPAGVFMLKLNLGSNQYTKTILKGNQ
ncbi:MAG: PKD domain-containing protein [Bacteroidetes bacterium]|nr:PKD domain-containing protein [Bacteroidota bacterium]